MDPLLASIAAASLPTATSAILRRFSGGKSEISNPTLDREEVDQATRVLREEFSRTETAGSGGTGSGSPTAVSTQTPAELEALAIMRVYAKDLTTEANRIAKRASADRPSKRHVRLAADRLGLVRDQAGVVSDVSLAVGAILIGAAVSYQINLWTGGQAQDGMGLVMTLTLAVGVGLTVAAIVLKVRKS
jgi:hypothetical protein